MNREITPQRPGQPGNGKMKAYYLEPVPKPRGWTKACGYYAISEDGEFYLSPRLIMQPNSASLCAAIDGEPKVKVKAIWLLRAEWLKANYTDEGRVGMRTIGSRTGRFPKAPRI